MADAYVSPVAPTTNFGTATKLDVQNLDDVQFPDDRRSYVGFDLSRIHVGRGDHRPLCAPQLYIGRR